MTGRRLRYRIVGRGRPRLVLLHGLFGSHRTWREVWPLFVERGHACVLVDLRGHGDSPKPSCGYAPRDYASDVARLIKSLGLDRPVVVGYSMGGRVGYTLAAGHTPPLGGLVIGDIGMEARPNSWRDVESLVERLPRRFRDAARAEAFLSSGLTPDEADYFRLCLSEGRRPKWLFSAKAVVETVRLGRARDWIGLAPKIPCPVLLVRGQNSTELSRGEVRRMMGGFKQGTFAEIAGVGHELHLERPELFVKTVASWLNGV